MQCHLHSNTTDVYMYMNPNAEVSFTPPWNLNVLGFHYGSSSAGQLCDLQLSIFGAFLRVKTVLLKLLALEPHDGSHPHQATRFCGFFLSEPVAFRRVYGLESCSRTSGESNHHRQSVSDVRNGAIPTEPRGRLQHATISFCLVA